MGIFFTLFNKYRSDSSRRSDAKHLPPRNKLQQTARQALRSATKRKQREQTKLAQNCRRLYRWLAYRQGQTVVFNGVEHECMMRMLWRWPSRFRMRWFVNQLDIAIGRDGNLAKP